MANPILHTFVDNSNVLIEGRRFSEIKRKGRSKLSPFTDDNYEIDWGKFLYVLKEQDSRGLAEVPILYGSRPPAEDSVWDRIRDDGFDVKVFDRNIRNKEKGVDMEMGMDIVERLHAVDDRCFRHQVLLRRDRHVHDGGSGRPTQVSEHPHVAQPPDNAPRGLEDVSKGQPPRGESRLHRGRPGLAPKLQRPMRANEVVVTA